MKFLLDTHAFMWWHSDPECIPKSTIHLLQDPDVENATLVSRDSVFKSYECSVIW